MVTVSTASTRNDHETAQLERLLGEAFAPLNETPALAALREKALVAPPGSPTSPASYEPLARRGLLVEVSARDYRIAGSHAELVRYLLARAGWLGVKVVEKRRVVGFTLSAPGARAISDRSDDKVDGRDRRRCRQ